MNIEFEQKLVKIAKRLQSKTDPSHDFQHVLRVLHLAKTMAKLSSSADLDVLIPATLFHDVVVHRKNSARSRHETSESALVAEKILNEIAHFPKEKIPHVSSCIRECSFSKGLKPSSLESAILQDADRLEATGAISIMRTFSSGGQMKRPFYPPEDPLCELSVVRFRSNLDLFYERLLLVKDMMHTEYGKRIAKQRTSFLLIFLKQLRRELVESKVLKRSRRSNR